MRVPNDIVSEIFSWYRHDREAILKMRRLSREFSTLARPVAFETIIFRVPSTRSSVRDNCPDDTLIPLVRTLSIRQSLHVSGIPTIAPRQLMDVADGLPGLRRLELEDVYWERDDPRVAPIPHSLASSQLFQVRDVVLRGVVVHIIDAALVLETISAVQHMNSLIIDIRMPIGPVFPASDEAVPYTVTRLAAYVQRHAAAASPPLAVVPIYSGIQELQLHHLEPDDMDRARAIIRHNAQCLRTLMLNFTMYTIHDVDVNLWGSLHTERCTALTHVVITFPLLLRQYSTTDRHATEDFFKHVVNGLPPSVISFGILCLITRHILLPPTFEHIAWQPILQIVADKNIPQVMLIANQWGALAHWPVPTKNKIQEALSNIRGTAPKVQYRVMDSPVLADNFPWLSPDNDNTLPA